MSFTSSRSSWLSCFRTCIHSWSTFSTCSRVSWSFRTCIHSRSACFSITCRWLRICRLFSCTSGRSFCVSFFTSSRISWLSCFRTSIHSRSTFITSCWSSWSYGGTFTFGCTSGRSFSMSFTSGWLFSVSSFTSSWICRLFSMSFASCWVIRLSFFMFRLLIFTVFICINDIFT